MTPTPQPARTRAPRLSVVVPALDEERWLPLLLASLAGEHAPEEVIVVDGGSGDRTRSLARAAGARVLRSPAGRGRQLALGASEACGDVLCFLHADGRLEQGALAALRAAFADGTLAACGLRQRIDHRRRVYRWIEAAADARVRRGWVYGDSGLCVRRDAYDAVGGFRPFDVFEDLDLSRRLRAHGRVRLVDGAGLVISPRRWEREGVVLRTAKNWVLTLAWRMGVHPSRLVRYYRPEARAPGEAAATVHRTGRPAQGGSRAGRPS